MASDDTRTAYEQLCNSYRSIDEFRGKLLGFLPFATGFGLFALTKQTSGEWHAYAPVIGVIGMVVTFGLYLFELHGIASCDRLIETGKQLECEMGVRGQFRRSELVGVRWFLVNVLCDIPLAAGLIYATVMASWVLVSLIAGQVALAPWQWALGGVLITLMALAPVFFDHKVAADLGRRQRDNRGTELTDAASVRIKVAGPPVEVVLCQECSKALLAGSRT